MSEVHDDDVYVEDDDRDEADGKRVGRVGRWKMRARRKWSQWVESSIPEDDDGPENLPLILHGTRGRIILAASTVVVLGAWVVMMIAVLG